MNMSAEVLMTNLTIRPGGELTLPSELCLRYGFKPTTAVRVIETRTGILLIPLTDSPMLPALAQELTEWQTLGASTWENFPYDETDGLHSTKSLSANSRDVRRLAGA